MYVLFWLSIVLVIYTLLNVLGFFPWSVLYGAWPWHKGGKK